MIRSPGVLHRVPMADAMMLSFSQKHGIKQHKYFKAMLAGSSNVPVDKDEQRWQMPCQARWLQHAESGELVVVIDGPTFFLSSERAKQPDMSFNNRKLQRALKSGTADTITSADGSHLWLIKAKGYTPAELASVGDGASLTGLVAPVDKPAGMHRRAPFTLPDFVRAALFESARASARAHCSSPCLTSPRCAKKPDPKRILWPREMVD